jgi:hypothetical protein
MNMITVLIVALVLGAYYYPACPKMLKDNKQMLLGVFVGLLAGQYLGVKIEGGVYSTENFEKVSRDFWG